VATVVFAPWALRSYVASGNPVFPIAAQSLGTGAWGAEQCAAWNDAHGLGAAGASLGARLGALAHASLLDDNWFVSAENIARWSDPALPVPATDHAAGVISTVRHFGWLWPALLGLAIGALWRRHGAAWPLLLVLGLQTAGWLFATHLQARFLWPILPTLALLGAEGIESILSFGDGRWRALLAWLSVCVLGGQAVGAAFLLTQEFKTPEPPAGREESDVSRAMAAGMLTASPEIFALPDCFLSDMKDAAAPTTKRPRGIEVPLPPGSERHVLLIGSATPYLYPGTVLYTTAWDRPSWCAVLASGAPERIAAFLYAQRIDLLVVDFSEMDRLHKSYGTPLTLNPAVLGQLQARGVIAPLDTVPGVGVRVWQVVP